MCMFTGSKNCGKHPPEVYEPWLEAIKAANTSILVSSEALAAASSFGSSMPERLAELLKDYDVQIVMFHR